MSLLTFPVLSIYFFVWLFRFVKLPRDFCLFLGLLPLHFGFACLCLDWHSAPCKPCVQLYWLQCRPLGLWWLTLPLTVSPLCSRATGALCSRFSSICQAMTVMFPTRTFSADLTHRDIKSVSPEPKSSKSQLLFLHRVLCLRATWESGAVCGACPAAALSLKTWTNQACTSVAWGHTQARDSGDFTHMSFIATAESNDSGLPCPASGPSHHR